MKIEILLARDGGESRGAVLTDGVLTDYRAQRAAAPSRAGGVYRARVKKIVPGLAGAVVEIPDGEAWLDLARTRGAKPREGALVTIQIVQDAQGGKLARAAADPMLAGRFLAFQPFAAKSALSHRIADNDARARLGALLAKFGKEGALIALHTAPDASDAALAAEAQHLRGAWQRAGPTLEANAPGEAIAPADPALDLLRLFVGSAAARIAADSEIDADLAAILLVAVDRDRGKRHQSMQDLCAALAAYLESIWPGRGSPV